ncbi:MAG: HAD family hydrolase, partial [Clostridia bacterium]
TLKPYAAEFLARLKTMGIKTALCTSSPESYYEPALKRLGVYDYFDAFATTGEAGVSKHYPDVFLLAAERLGAEPENCTAFEDIPEAILGAKKAGMKTCGVFDARSGGEMEYMKQICDRYIMNLEEFFQ